MWRRIWLVAARDYAENVRTKAFLLGVFLVPGLISLMLAVLTGLERLERAAKPFAVLDRTGGAYAALLRDALAADAEAVRKFSWEAAPAGADGPALARLVDEGRLFAYVEIPADLLDGGPVTYAARTIAYEDLRRWVKRKLDEVVRTELARQRGLDQALVDRLREPVRLTELAVGAAGATAQVGLAERARAYAPMAFVYFLWIAIMTVAQMLLTSVIEEKSNRIFEILLSSLSPGELMAGKILASAATGLTMLGLWLGAAFLLKDWGVRSILGPGSPRASEFLRVFAEIVGPWNLAFFAGYFVLGFLFWASCFAAVGSLINSVKEAQNLMGPLIGVMIVPILTMTFVTKNPGDPIGVVLSWIPPFTPFVMLNRVTAVPPAPLWEVGATLVLLLASVVTVFWLAGRIFRVGILMTGKPPSLPEILRILRRG